MVHDFSMMFLVFVQIAILNSQRHEEKVDACLQKLQNERTVEAAGFILTPYVSQY